MFPVLTGTCVLNKHILFPKNFIYRPLIMGLSYCKWLIVRITYQEGVTRNMSWLYAVYIWILRLIFGRKLRIRFYLIPLRSVSICLNMFFTTKSSKKLFVRLTWTFAHIFISTLTNIKTSNWVSFRHFKMMIFITFRCK